MKFLKDFFFFFNYKDFAKSTINFWIVFLIGFFFFFIIGFSKFVSFFSNLYFFKLFFVSNWNEPCDVFFFTLIGTHNYIFLYLIFVITVVCWLLYVILYNFLWGKSTSGCFFCKFSFFNNIYFYLDFLFFFVRATLYFWIMFFVLNFHVFFLNWINNNGIYFFRDNKSIVEYFLDKRVKTNKYYRLLFFFSGHWRIVKGYYAYPFHSLEVSDLKKIKVNKRFFLFKMFNFLMIPRWFSLYDKVSFPNNIKHNDYFVDNLNKLFFIILKQKKQKFIFGRFFTRAFALTDKGNKRERFFSFQKWRHSLKLEIFWAIAPAIIIGIILIPSLVLLYSSAVIRYADHFLLVTANQWFWNYQSGFIGKSRFHFFFFPSKRTVHFFDIDKGSILNSFKDDFIASFWDLRFDRRYIFGIEIKKGKDKGLIKDPLSFFHNLQFDSYILDEGDLSLDSNKRLYETDVHSVNPCFMALKMTISSLDVLHSFSLPSLGIKVDAVLGRINDFTTFIAKETLLMGQCSELCGSGHAFMPIFFEIMHPFDFYSSREEEFWRFLDFKGNCPLYNLKSTGIDEKLLKKEELNFNYKLYSFKKNITREF